MFAAVLIVSNTNRGYTLAYRHADKIAFKSGCVHTACCHPNDFSVIGAQPQCRVVMMLFPFIAGLIAFILLVKPLNKPDP